jgi:NADH:ubiquinone oxidoreductase subunit H
MTRKLWITGLSLALLVFGGWTILIVFAGVTHRHLNQKGLLMLVCNACAAWITFNYLRQKLGDRRSDQ